MILVLFQLLLIVLFILNNMSASFKILLLTHAKELNRKSNTGRLITDPSFAKLISWEGRGDNIKVSEAIDNLCQPVLIWIEGPKIIKEDKCAAHSDPTYVILGI
jgi:DTW domain-containing protein YfiP